MAGRPERSGSLVAYCITHQAREGQAQESYLRTIRELHRRVQEEAARIEEANQKASAENVTRDAQVAYGLLSQFLVTPLRTDQMEVKKILAEAMGRIVESSRGEMGILYRDSELSRTIPFRSHVPEIVQMTKAAAEYLKGLGFRAEKSEIYASNFFVGGGVGLDLLEQIVRDRLGIYASPHGRHIEDAGAWTFAAYNVVREEKVLEGDGEVLVEMPLSKPAPMQYDGYRASLSSLVGDIKGVSGVVRVSLWQRKLGLGPGREFLLRIHCSQVDDVTSLGNLVFAAVQRLFPKTSPSSSLIVREILSI